MIRAPKSKREIERADPGTRKKAIVVLLIIFLIGFIAIYYIDLFLKANRESFLKNPKAAMDTFTYLANIFIIFNYLLFFPFCGYIFHISKKIIASKRYPPPGMKLCKDTPIITDRKACIIGYIGMALATILILLSFVIHWLLYSFIQHLKV